MVKLDCDCQTVHWSELIDIGNRIPLTNSPMSAGIEENKRAQNWDWFDFPKYDAKEMLRKKRQAPR